MKSPPPMPPPPPPPPSYQESLKQMQRINNEISNQYEFNTDNLNYSNRPSQLMNTSQNKNLNNNLKFSNESSNQSPSMPFSSSNDEVRQFLKTQQQNNTSNKRDLAQYLSNQQSYKNMFNSEFLRHNSPVNNFIAHQNYTSTKRPATNFTSDIEKELSDLTLTIEREMERQMEDKSEYFGICGKCNKGVFGRKDACQAQEKIYHNSCFICTQCSRMLRGKSFYNVNNHIYCEEDYLYSGFLENAEKCNLCGQIIVDIILQACGKSYHPNCFRCYSCNECLDGVPFTLDINNHFYCINDYYKKYSPQCESCNQSIIPKEGSTETVRVVAMDKNYHLECFVCKGCGIPLSDEFENRCFPIDGNNLFCYTCFMNNFEVQ